MPCKVGRGFRHIHARTIAFTLSISFATQSQSRVIDTATQLALLGFLQTDLRRPPE